MHLHSLRINTSGSVCVTWRASVRVGYGPCQRAWLAECPAGRAFPLLHWPQVERCSTALCGPEAQFSYTKKLAELAAAAAVFAIRPTSAAIFCSLDRVSRRT